MLEYLKFQFEAGHDVVVIMNHQTTLTVQVEHFDTLGMVARVKGRMSGFGERRVFPWSSIEWLSWER